MDSLLSTYASSDDDDDDDQQPPPPHQTPSSKLTSSLPKSQSCPPPSSPSSRFFSSLPPPKPSSNRQTDLRPGDPLNYSNSNSKPSSSLFSLLPPPNSQITPIIPLNPNPKKVKVQFHPPKFANNPDFRQDEEDEVDEEEREAKKRRQLGYQDTSVKSFLSSIPAPKNSGSAALGGALGGRRSIIDASVPVSTPVVAPTPVVESGLEQNVGISPTTAGYDEQHYNNNNNVYSYDVSRYGDYEGYGQQNYDGNNVGLSGETVQGTSSGVESFIKMGGGGKRRKDQPPFEILEVKQDELMKNRPTEDKSKLTGMAFGPAYQPASSKGKPSKLHKRKHQIGSLYHDMRSKEPELQERRSKGLLTKAETHAKYGW